MSDIPSLTTGIFEVMGNLRGYSDTFIETGTLVGGGVSAAAQIGFTTIHSIEIHQGIHEDAKERLRGIMALPGVTVNLHLGDSTVLLPQILSSQYQPCVVLLDAHIMDGEERSKSVTSPCPSWNLSCIRNDLKALKNAPVHNHAILIDDIQWCDRPEMDSISLLELVNSILDINPAYRFSKVTDNMLQAIPTQN